LDENCLGREHEIELAISAFECAVPDQGGVLAASPVSSGHRYLKLLQKFSVRSKAELIERIGPDEFQSRIIAPNLEDGRRFAARLRQGGQCNVIFTGPLYHPDWAFDDYIRVCLFLLERKCSAVYFNDGWEYSTGSVMEFGSAASRGLAVYSSEGAALTAGRARHILSRSLEVVKCTGLDTGPWDDALRAAK
jgi:hypothetical protein